MEGGLQKEDITSVSESTGELPSRCEDTCAISQTSSRVALENINESMRFKMLTLLIENISDLSVEKDFQIELIRERNAAVITFSQCRGKDYKLSVAEIFSQCGLLVCNAS